MNANSDLDFAENVNYWENRWVDSRTGWHKDTVNPNLISNFNRLINNKNSNNEKKKVLIPLCGKTLDIDYVLKEGHCVLAVEAVAKAIQDLEVENSFGLKFNESESIYQTDDGRLRIFCGDLFGEGFQKFLTKYGPADIVWDRGSFVALEYKYRSEYIKVIQSAVRINSGEYADFRYLLETLDYDRTKFGGPPRAVNAEDMETYFGDWTNYEIVNRVLETQGAVSKIPDMGPFDQVVYLLKRK